MRHFWVETISHKFLQPQHLIHKYFSLHWLQNLLQIQQLQTQSYIGKVLGVELQQDAQFWLQPNNVNN